MDISEEYQEMVKAAPEIQKLWSPNVGDYHTWNGDISVIGRLDFKSITHHEIRDKTVWGDKEQYGQYIIGYFNEWVIMDFNSTTPYNVENIVKQFHEIYTTYDNCVWLPRQDQLQDMLSATTRELLFYNHRILDRWDADNDKNKTMEQLWLMLIMYLLFSKSWNGNKWV